LKVADRLPKNVVCRQDFVFDAAKAAASQRDK